jgi:hypothetical protein
LVVGHSNTVLEMIEALGAKDQSSLKIKTTIIFSTHHICKRKNKSQSHALRQPNSDKEGAQMMR